MRRNWTEDELLIALSLYCKLPFGKFHQHTPLIQQAAEQMDRTPSSVAMKLSNLASLDPVITESGRRGLPSASALDKKMWGEFSSNATHWMPIIEERLDQLLGTPPASMDRKDTKDKATDYSAEDVTTTSTRRKGQNLFREAVLSAYNSRCCLTGVAEPRLLIASHIKPWSADATNRLNPHNGLCLSALVDRAFDKGLITFSEDYRLVISPLLSSQRNNEHIHETFYKRKDEQLALPEKFTPNQDFLAWHREKIFLH